MESNRLYTPYLDLRPPRSMGPPPYTGLDDSTTAVAAQDAVAGLIEMRDDRRAVRAIDAKAGGVRLLTLPELVATDEGLARRLLEGRAAPARRREARRALAGGVDGRDRRARAGGVRVERPIVLRWSLGAPRTLVGRTLIILEDGAEATVVEELVANDAARPGAQALLSATTEIRLGAQARLAMASLQELGPDHVVFQQRAPTSARARTCAGRLPSWGAASSAPAWTTCSRVIGAPSSRWRSCSGRTTSCTTSPRTPATSAGTPPGSCCPRACSSTAPGHT